MIDLTIALVMILIIIANAIGIQIFLFINKKNKIINQNYMVNKIQIDENIDIMKFITMKVDLILDIFFFDNPHYLSGSRVFKEDTNDDFREVMDKINSGGYANILTKEDYKLIGLYFNEELSISIISKCLINRLSGRIMRHVKKVNDVE